MNANVFDRAAREAVSGVSRRASLAALGIAVLTGMTKRGAVAKGANKRKRCKALCRRQRTQCRRAINDVCAEAVAPELCREGFLPSCDSLARCNAEKTVRQLFVLQ